MAAPASVAPTLAYCRATEPDCEDPVAYPFGTDAQGRDMFAVAVAGTWMTIRIGLFAGIIGVIIGTFLGFTSAYYGGIYDGVVRWMVDVLLTIPGLLILVVIASSIGDRGITINGMALDHRPHLVAWRRPRDSLAGVEYA